MGWGGGGALPWALLQGSNSFSQSFQLFINKVWSNVISFYLFTLCLLRIKNSQFLYGRWVSKAVFGDPEEIPFNCPHGQLFAQCLHIQKTRMCLTGLHPFTRCALSIIMGKAHGKFHRGYRINRIWFFLKELRVWSGWDMIHANSSQQAWVYQVQPHHCLLPKSGRAANLVGQNLRCRLCQVQE